MDIFKRVGYVLLAIVGVTVFFSIGAFLAVLGFVVSVILTGVFFIGFVAFLIKAYFDMRARP